MTGSTVRFGLLGAAAITPLAMVTPAREVDGVSLDVIAARDPARAQEFAEIAWHPSCRRALSSGD